MTSDTPVLIVDDSAAIRQTVKSALAAFGYATIHTANSGQEALDLCRRHPVKIILLDWNMPELDGISFLKIYREELGVKNTAVIMLTSKGDKKDILTALESGATGYITKPVSTETIKSKMQQAEKWLLAHGPRA